MQNRVDQHVAFGRLNRFRIKFNKYNSFTEYNISNLLAEMMCTN